MAVVAGRFEILSQAGTGGMGSVFRARDRQSGKLVAVKVLKVDRMFDVARFEREAQTLAAVHHPNIVDYIAHGEAEGLHFLVQEWVDGITLATHATTIGTTAQEAVTISLGIARALEAIHSSGLIHRDIKPANVILAGGEAERIKLVDFGIARLANEAGVLTRTGMLIGTPAYMSPEQARGLLQIEAAADVWSLGCVLFELLTGQVAFSGKTPAAIRAKVLLGEPPAFARRCPEAPDELCELLLDMLEKEPGQRPVDGGAVAARLLALPPIPDGPRRKVGARQADTTPVRSPQGSAPRKAPSLFVMFDAASVRGAPGHDARMAQLAERHNLDAHVFEDGSAVLASRGDGKQAAKEAVDAALELRRDVFDAAISVFGRAFDDTLSDAVDRGSVLLEQATMATIFGDVVDDAGPVVHIDDVIADLLHDEVEVIQTPEGPVLSATETQRFATES
ncbi:MAG TPA: serine/threonine-protein kinase [Kofleriaceae bacterium]|nr:serine/threonine-protein kinase [Kofleriaceae bacterium]